ncbi:hypothetical protein HDV06_005184 [Boothiomyces sp. JEL0866]|nr:hypothetical protein HDV06_005184 [Boothiomyces sp. JEL0866]
MNLNQVSSEIVEFRNGGEVAGVALHALFGLFGSIGVIIVLMATVPKKNNASTLLLISLCCADLMFCVTTVVFGSKDLSSGGWSTGHTGCILNSCLILGACFASVFCIIAITLERYKAVMHGKLLSNSDARLWICAIWISSILISTFPLYTGSDEYALALHPGKVICAVAWWDRSPLTIIMITLSMVTLAVSVSFIVYAYVMIVVKFVSTQAAFHSSENKSDIKSAAADRKSVSKGQSTVKGSASTSAHASKVNSEKPEKNSRDKEKILLIKSILISGTFIVCWTPYLMMIIYSLITGTPAPSAWDSIACIFAVTNSAVNPLLLVALDSRIQSYVFEMLGIGEK